MSIKTLVIQIWESRAGQTRGGSGSGPAEPGAEARSQRRARPGAVPRTGLRPWLRDPPLLASSGAGPRRECGSLPFALLSGAALGLVHGACLAAQRRVVVQVPVAWSGADSAVA